MKNKTEMTMFVLIAWSFNCGMTTYKYTSKDRLYKKSLIKGFDSKEFAQENLYIPIV